MTVVASVGSSTRRPVDPYARSTPIRSSRWSHLVIRRPLLGGAHATITNIPEPSTNRDLSKQRVGRRRGAGLWVEPPFDDELARRVLGPST